MTEAALQPALDKLRFELGVDVVSALDDPDVHEVMCNSDGVIWVERRGEGMSRLGAMSAVNARALLGTVAHVLETVVTAESPIVEGCLPLGGERFEGLAPPVSRNPVWTIRKRATKVWTLDDYVTQQVLTETQSLQLREVIAERRNILIAGGTGTGKTTFANALIHEIVRLAPTERLVIIEDTPELQCSAENAVMLETSRSVTMTDLLKASMRMRPDRILVGEVRGGEALTLLKAWTTGHPGGVATVHAESVVGAALRMQSLAAEAGGPTFADLSHFIDETLDLTVVIARDKNGQRLVTDIGNHMEQRGHA